MPIILATFILNNSPNVIFITLKSSVTGELIPNCSPYDSHHKAFTEEAISPSKPPITIPANKNIINIDMFFSFIAIIASPFHRLLLLDHYIFILYFFQVYIDIFATSVVLLIKFIVHFLKVIIYYYYNLFPNFDYCRLKVDSAIIII